MSTLEERFEASHRIRARLGRVGPDGKSLPLEPHHWVAPDLERIIGEAAFGLVWNREGLSIEHRCFATIAALTALDREPQLKAYIEGALNVGIPGEQIIEALMHLFFYVGAPLVNGAMRVAASVFQEQNIAVQPDRVYDPTEDVDALFERGQAKRREILDDPDTETSGPLAEVDQARERYSREYLWGAIWSRPGLDMQSRVICTLSGLTVLGRERMIRTYVEAAERVGLTQAQVMELFMHLSIYTGFPCAWSAIAVAKEVWRSK